MKRKIPSNKAGDTVFSLNYNKNCKSLDGCTWYDVRPYSTVLWVEHIADIERRNSWYCVREVHMSMIVEYFLEGRVIYEVNGRRHIVEPGTLCITWPRNPKLVLRSCNDEYARNIRAVIGGGALLSIIELLNPRRENIIKLNLFQQNIFLSKIKKLTGMLKRKDPAEIPIVALDSYDFLLFICSLFNDAPGDESPEVSRAVRFMVNCREEVKSVARIAELCGISISTLNRMFNERFGMPPKQYWDMIRFEHAANELKKTDLPVKQIGFNNGFSDPLYFSTAFRKRYNCSPSEYRAKEKTKQ